MPRLTIISVADLRPRFFDNQVVAVRRRSGESHACIVGPLHLAGLWCLQDYEVLVGGGPR